ncbi:GD15109 [Drosophila simulans]|uniref:GD15109 n=1 Tax=Drosophila simulans TaxID=7240 RepID=B4NTA4_DROSI|nr:GD15109 [Drosophila simulans]
MDHRVFLSLIFVLSGTFNVLVVKWANQQQVIGSDGKLHGFQHPVVFTLLMFLGEFLCFVAFKVIRLISSRRGVSSNAGWFITGNAFVLKKL